MDLKTWDNDLIRAESVWRFACKLTSQWIRHLMQQIYFAAGKQVLLFTHLPPFSSSLILLHPSPVVSAVILPTIWRYLQILEAPPYFLGLGLAAFSLSGLLTGPLFGIWSDRSRTTKSIILFSNLFEIAGEKPHHITWHGGSAFKSSNCSSYLG